MTLMGVGTVLGGGTITAGSAGTASPLGLFLVVEGTGQAGIGLSYMLAGLLEDPEHFSEDWLNEENTICVYDAKTSDKNPEEVIKQYLQGMLWIPNEEQ